MDMQKMGSFLKELRKDKNMTQEELGEKLGVTNKTISRWETGKYMPPVECLEMLSDMYGLSINELLSGKQLESDDYISNAEDNLKSTLFAMEKETKRFERGMIILFAITTILAIIAISILPFSDTMTDSEIVRQFIVMGIIIAIAFISNTVNIMVNVLAMALKNNK